MNNLTNTEQAKIVYNACYGGFGLSHDATLRLAEMKGIKVYPEKIMSDLYHYWLEPLAENENRHSGASFKVSNLDRHDRDLVRVVEEMGEYANCNFAKLKIKTVNKGTLYRIDEYDGYEEVICQYDDAWSVAE